MDPFYDYYITKKDPWIFQSSQMCRFSTVFCFLEVEEDPWILFLTTMSLTRIHGSSTTSKTFRGVEYVRIFQLVINEEDEKIVNL